MEKFFSLLSPCGTESIPEIQRNFRNLSRGYHPDKFPTRSEEFKLLCTARDKLVNDIETGKRIPRGFDVEFLNNEYHRMSIVDVLLLVLLVVIMLSVLVVKSNETKKRKIRDIKSYLSKK